MQLYYFVHLEFLSFSPTPNTFPYIKHLYFTLSHLTLVQGQTELPAAPLSFASMPVRLQSVSLYFCILCLLFSPSATRNSAINVYNSCMYTTQGDDDVLLGVQCSSGAEYEDPLLAAQGDSCNLLSLFIASVIFLVLYSSQPCT